jgi:hypothetical protein
VRVVSSSIGVPETLRRPHRFVAATREASVGVKSDESGRLDVGRRPGVVYLHVSREQLRRALLIAQAVVAEAERRGWEVKPIEKSYNHRAGCAVVVRGHSYPFEITEMTDRRPLDERELERWRRENRYRLSYQPDLEPPQAHVPNGRLRLSLPDYHVKRANWTEGPRGPLEAKLASAFVELVRRANEDDRRDAERRAWEEERQRQAAARAERGRLARIEQARADRLAEEVAAWRLSRDVRMYIEELRERLPELEADERERVAGWCDWAEAWAARHDPTVNLAKIVGLDEAEPEPTPFWWGGAPAGVPTGRSVQ